MIIIPMVGASSRFFKAGYTLPKYQLPLWGKTVFHYVMLSFVNYFERERFVFVIRNSYDAEDFVKRALVDLDIKEYSIVVLDEITAGQAETVYKAVADIDVKEPLTIFNIDTIRYNFNYPEFIDSCDGYLEVFDGEGDHWSFVEPGDDNKVVRTTEKDRISNLCSNGLYYFSDLGNYKSAYHDMLVSNNSVNGEFYVAPMFNHSIARSEVIKYSLINNNEIDFCGTPNEYKFLVARGPKF